jgi:hypothetical protein
MMRRRVLVLIAGALIITCTFGVAGADEVGARGDCNFDGHPYEVADAVRYLKITQCDMYPTFVPCTQNLPDSTFDINADGVAFTVADLVYLIRVIMGDVEPISDATPVAPAPEIPDISPQRGAGANQVEVMVTNSR